MNKLGFLTQTIFFAATMSVALLPDLVSAQNVEITLSSRVEVDNAPYTGSAQVKAVIIDEAQTSLWSNDSTSSAASEPAGSIAVTVLDGNFNITLGGTGTATLAGSIFDGAAKRFVLLWLDAGAGFERFDPLPISTVPRAVTALRLGNLPAADYLTTSSTLSIGNTDLSEAISSDNIAAFSDGGDTFTLGDGSVTGNKLLEADVGATNNPALRFNTTSSTWQFSNDGTTFTDVGSAIASDFVGPGSTTSAVDLNSAEVAGVLPLANGGTGAATAAAARISLGVDIGVDVQAYLKNNLAAVTGPTATDDSAAGYAVGSTWVDTAAGESYVAVDVTAGAAVWSSTTAANAASIADDSITNAKLADDAVTTAEVLDGTLVDADISASAAIAHSKLANINAGRVLLGNAGNVPTATAISGDATLTSGGVLALTAGSVSGTEIAIGGDAQGDLLYYNGSAWTRLGAGTSGNILVTGGTGANPSWAAAGSLQVQQPVLGRRLGSSTPLTTAATAFTAVGMTAPTVTVAGTAQPALSGTRMYIRFATTAVANNSNGITGPLTETRPGYRPKYTSLLRTDSTIASRRIWVGLTSAVLTAVPTNTTGSPATAASFVGIAYDTGGTGNVTDWLCCSGDGANYSCTTTGVAVAIDTDYVMSVDWSTVGTLRCTVNSTSVNKTTNLATGATNMGPYNNITTLAAVIANHNIAKQALEQN